jgi:hypothetical protein
MGALILMLPVLAFDIWLLATTGKTQWMKWARPGERRRLAGALTAGVALGVWLAFFVGYKWTDKARVTGFPIPTVYFYLEDGKWVDSIPVPIVKWAAVGVNFLSGFAATMAPFRFAEFLRSVKAELAR